MQRMRITPSDACKTSVIKKDEQYISSIYKSIETSDIRRNNELFAVGNIEDSICNQRHLTLKQINERAGVNGIAEAFVLAYLHDMADYLAFNEPISEEQYIYTSRIMVKNYGYLKAREVLIFFAQVKSGKYGKFYGKFDPLLFNDFLQSFVSWRNEQIEYVAKRERQKRYEEEKKQSVDLKTFLARHTGERFENLQRILMKNEVR